MILLLALSGMGSPVAASGAVRHLYNLSDFFGTVPYSHVTLHFDRDADEIFVSEGTMVRIFSDSGMETFSFGRSPRLGLVQDLVVEQNGQILTLSRDPSLYGSFFLCRCSFRGEALTRIGVTDLPRGYEGFLPDRILEKDADLLLLSEGQMRAIVVDRDGRFLEGIDFVDLLGLPEEDRDNYEIGGFSFDVDGSMLFTVPVNFRAYRISTDGQVRPFGQGGSAPGMFGIVAGVVADGNGNYLVADKLRSAVLVFDEQFNFVREFGYRGDRPENLVRPDGLTMGAGGKLYVTQAGKRGVSVFSLNVN